MNHRAILDLCLGKGAGIGDCELAPGRVEVVHGGTVDSIDLHGVVGLAGPLVRQRESRPDALDGIDQGDIGGLVAAR